MMNQNEEVAWLHVQDMQREAENRRLIAARRPLAIRAGLRRLLARATGSRQSSQPVEHRREPA
jgi:hypothetical protein